MKASQAKISKLIGYSEKQFIIPIYQREYKWGKTNIERFIDDLEEIDIHETNQNHFLNSIVYSKIEENPHASYIGSRVEKYYIIDGQQRVTTISILLIAIRNFLRENNNSEADRINNQFLINQYVQEENVKQELDLVKKIMKFIKN